MANKEKKGYYLGEKLKPGVTAEFVEAIERTSTQDKRDLIVELQKQINDARVFLATKEEILTLKGQLELLQGPSQQTIRFLNNRTKFLIDRLKETEPSTA
jgi:hypothetical protein